MNIRLVFTALVPLLMVACGTSSAPAPSLSRPPATATPAPTLIPSPGPDIVSPPASPSPSPGGAASGALPGAPPGITAVDLATSVGPDGAAVNPVMTFNADTDRKIIAVITLASLPAGTRLSYVRYLEGRMVDSKSATLTKVSRSFRFEFTAGAGTSFPRGHYRLRVFLNRKPAWEVAYQVT